MAHTSRSSTPACIIHCRVSTAKQAYEGESLDVQTNICAAIAASKSWAVAHDPWKEGFSGRKEVRPVFQEILAFLDANPGAVQYYLFRSIDRATRGGSFSYEGMKRALLARGVEMVDSYGIIQPARNTLEDLGFEYPWSVSSPSEIAEVVMATSAKADLTSVLTRLIGQEIRLRRQGYKIRGPVDGFVNERVFVDGRKRVVERPDPERAKYFVAMFQLRAAGQLTDEEICDRLNAMGFRTRRLRRWDEGRQKIIGSVGGVPLSVKRLQEMIRRPIYCGLICEKWTNWEPIRAAYDGLVSLELFNAANRGKVVISLRPDGRYVIEHGVAEKKSRENPTFPFRRVIVCPICRKPFAGSSPRGRNGRCYPTYHCSKQHKYYGVSKEMFEGAIARFISSLRFTPEVVTVLRQALAEQFNKQQALLVAERKTGELAVAKIERLKTDAIRAFAATTSDVIRRGLEAEVERLEDEIRRATEIRSELGVSPEEMEDFINDVAQVLERPAILLEYAVTTQQFETLYGFTFEKPPSYEEIEHGTAEMAWIFAISNNLKNKSALVHLRDVSWKQVETSILKWKAISKPLKAILSRQSP